MWKRGKESESKELDIITCVRLLTFCQMKQGKLIIIEGLNGSGKSTYINQLSEKYMTTKKNHCVFHFPRYDRLPGVKQMLERTDLTLDQKEKLDSRLLSDLMDGEDYINLLLQ